MPAPARIVEHGAGEPNHIGLAYFDHGLGLLRLGDEADRAGGDAGLAPYALGEAATW